MSRLVIIEFKPTSIRHALDVMQSNTTLLERIAGQARDLGAEHHKFYADQERGVLVAVDTWTSDEAFRKFFEGNTDIAEVMEQAGVREEPQIRILETVDAPGTF